MAYLEFDPNQHAYFHDGRELPSVTQILDKAGLVSQFCKDEQARWRGTSVHSLCADDDISNVDLRTVPAELRGYLKAWRRYRKESGFQPTAIECRVDCLAHGYSGKYDRLGVLPGIRLPVLLDIKTSVAGTVAPYVRLQLSAYCFALDPKKIFYRMAVALRPDGSYRVKNYLIDQYTSDVAEWLALVERVKSASIAE